MLEFKIQRVDSCLNNELIRLNIKNDPYFVSKIDTNSEDAYPTIFCSSPVPKHHLYFSLKFARWWLKQQLEKYPNSYFRYRIVCLTQ